MHAMKQFTAMYEADKDLLLSDYENKRIEVEATIAEAKRQQQKD